jgi:3-methyladenine DNA glycosylase AlkD
MLAALVDDPRQVTVEQMDAWVADCDNWALCDTICFHLFDRTPLAWGRIPVWAAAEEEFVKRAAYALLASLAGHDKRAQDSRFLGFIPLIVEGAQDGRNFVKKAVSWALRRIGTRNETLRAAALSTAAQLAESAIPSARWVGKDALRDLNRGRQPSTVGPGG